MIKSDKWIRRTALATRMIEPFEPGQVREVDGKIAQIYKEIARKVAISVAQKAADFSAKFPSIVIQKDT